MSLACSVINQIVETSPADLMQRAPGVVLNQNPNKPSLSGFICLCLKNSLMMSKENVSSHDNDFIGALNYLVNMNKQNNFDQLMDQLAEEEHSK